MQKGFSSGGSHPSLCQVVTASETLATTLSVDVITAHCRLCGDWHRRTKIKSSQLLAAFCIESSAFGVLRSCWRTPRRPQPHHPASHQAVTWPCDARGIFTSTIDENGLRAVARQHFVGVEGRVVLKSRRACVFCVRQINPRGVVIDSTIQRNTKAGLYS